VANEDCGVVFLPFLYASNVNINAKACFIGLSSYHNRDNMLRAVYEGIVFSHKYHIEKLLKYRKAPKSIRIAGGVAKSRVWVQMFADILQVPIEVTECTELGALGAAICAGVATGTYESFKAASDVMVEIAFTAVPNPDKQAMYEKKYNRYLKVINALDGIWDAY
jgi:L-xylulokinase